MKTLADPSSLQSFCRDRFDVEVSDDTATRISKRFRGLKHKYCISDCAICWLLVQLRKARVYPPSVGCQSANTDVATATLHVFFVRLRETVEMVDGLWEEAGKPAPKRRRTEELAVRRPIDKTAWKVAGFPTEGKT